MSDITNHQGNAKQNHEMGEVADIYKRTAVSLRPASATYGVPGKPGVKSETPHFRLQNKAKLPQ